MAPITLTNLHKSYANTPVVHGINLSIAHNEFVVLVGPSGCGKSTTLRMIAGLEDITSGDIHIGDTRVNDLPPRKRHISMVFQNYALYPHMNVRDNLGFGLTIAKQPKHTIQARVQEAADILGLSELMERMPGELSGGQRQRVAMGRAIVRQPQAFLFDEPLSNLDAKLRVLMRTEIKKLHQQVKTTVIYVTHDQVEAMTLADRIVVMRDGIIEQQGPPMEIFHHPANTFVASFIGSPPMNMLLAKITDRQVRLSDGTCVPIPARLAQNVQDGQEVILGFRPDDLTPENHGVHDEGGASLSLKINLAELLGSESLLYAQLAGQEVQAKMMNPYDVMPGQDMTFTLAIHRAHLFDAASTRSLATPQ
ncbi:MAG: sn-glycerol-3-phosphate ABC transporter ATP-binding protein UgpC [Pseudomonadota bacterium]